MRFIASTTILFIALLLLGAEGANAQVLRPLTVPDGARVRVTNLAGRVSVNAVADPAKASIAASSASGVAESEVVVDGLSITVRPENAKKRIDLTLTLPERTSVEIETADGEITVAGNFSSIKGETRTGSIVVDTPTDSVRYKLMWTASRPRVVADYDIEKIKEKSAGRFEISGRFGGETKAAKRKRDAAPLDPQAGDPQPDEKKPTATDVSLELKTERGIILLNVPPNEVGSDLRERPLTEAAKAIVRSGDSLLTEAIRRAAPKYYGDYSRTLPPIKLEPRFTAPAAPITGPAAFKKTAIVRVTDMQNRAIPDLTAKDFTVTESGERREVINVGPSSAPFNLVLLLDVSGSVEHYVDFIRKAARAFVETVGKDDRVSIITFNNDVKVVSRFTTDKGKLSESLDTFDAGGGTAYYDALAYTIADTLRPLKGERSAIVILTDGEDNASFLPFDALAGSIQESGALIYPLYVPHGLIEAGNAGGTTEIDPMRDKYMSLTARSQGEGERLAKISGGVYYPISRIGQIQAAYEDIVVQLRTAYSVTYSSASAANGVSPRLRIRVDRDDAFATVSSVVSADK